MKISKFMISTKDMDETISFYRDKLDFDVEYQTDDWSELRRDGLKLALKKVTTDNGIGCAGVGFSTEDCKKETEILREKGVKIILDCEEKKATPGTGEKIKLTQFKDPCGNILWISEYIGNLNRG